MPSKLTVPKRRRTTSSRSSSAVAAWRAKLRADFAQWSSCATPRQRPDRFTVGLEGVVAHSIPGGCAGSRYSYFGNRKYIRPACAAAVPLCPNCNFPPAPLSPLLGPVFCQLPPGVIKNGLLTNGRARLDLDPDYLGALRVRIQERAVQAGTTALEIGCSRLEDFLSHAERLHLGQCASAVLGAVGNGGRTGMVLYDPTPDANYPQALLHFKHTPALAQSAHTDVAGPGIYSFTFNVGDTATTGTLFFPQLPAPLSHHCMDALAEEFALAATAGDKDAVARKLVSFVLGAGAEFGEWAAAEPAMIDPGQGTVFCSASVPHAAVLPALATDTALRTILFFCVAVEVHLWPAHPLRQAPVFDALTHDGATDRPEVLYWSSESPVCYDGTRLFNLKDASSLLSHYIAAQKAFMQFDDGM